MTEGSGRQHLVDLEIELLLEGVWRWSGYDLRDYDRGFIRRRVQGQLRKERLRTPSQLLDRVLRRRAALEALVDVSPDVSRGLFRPVRSWRVIRHKVMPLLRTYASVRAWMVGCFPKDDLYSVLLILEEELARTYTLYATDAFEPYLQEARGGVLACGSLRDQTRNYLSAGGRRALSDYLEYVDGGWALLPALRRRLVLATHHLGSDASFNDFQLIVARSGFRRFNAAFRDRSLHLIHQSLVRFGFLMLGTGESLEGSKNAESYRLVDPAAGLFQKMED